MAMVETKPITADEFFDIPDPDDGSKLELVRGEVVAVSAPSVVHGKVQGLVYYFIQNYLFQNRIGTVMVESGAVIERNPDTVRGPDVSYYSKERLPLELYVRKYHDQAPDLCVEVVSPSNTLRELNEKVEEYLFAGVRVVWIVDPEDRTVTVYQEPKDGVIVKPDGTLDGGDVLPGFSCKVADFFG